MIIIPANTSIHPIKTQNVKLNYTLGIVVSRFTLTIKISSLWNGIYLIPIPSPFVGDSHPFNHCHACEGKHPFSFRAVDSRLRGNDNQGVGQNDGHSPLCLVG